MDCFDHLEEFEEFGVLILAESSCSSARKSPYYFREEYKTTRSFVSCILSEYVRTKESVCFPVKCVDVIGSTGINGLLWKKHLADKIDVIINDSRLEAFNIISKNSVKNNLSVEVTNKDPCIALHERGYNFIYLDCTNETSHLLHAAFRSLSRNGILVVTAKDDCSMHGNNPDVAMRRYGGRIARTFYYHELGIRLVLAALARTAAEYNKSISVLCCFMEKSSFTIAVTSQKGPALANSSLENIRLIKHCMVCEDREFYPTPNGFPIDSRRVKLSCDCENKATGNTFLELGPVWAAAIFNPHFIEGMISQKIAQSDNDLQILLLSILEEAKCPNRKSPTDKTPKKLKVENVWHPPFYFNIHKHHPQSLHRLVKINRVIEGLKAAGFRASRTHFDKLAIRTDAPLEKLLNIMKYPESRQT